MTDDTQPFPTFKFLHILKQSALMQKVITKISPYNYYILTTHFCTVWVAPNKFDTILLTTHINKIHFTKVCMRIRMLYAGQYNTGN